MKTVRTALIITMLTVAAYFCGYWLFIKRDLVSCLSPRDDPFGSTDSQRVIKRLFEPLREIDLRVTHDRPLRAHLTGYWSLDSASDFVRVDADSNCEFHLGDFQYKGPVAYNRNYGGFCIEFFHTGNPHIFILGYSDGIETENINDDRAIAFIGHDPKPLFRETDYELELTRTVEKSQ